MKKLSELRLAKGEILAIQRDLIARGYLHLPGEPNGGGGPLTDAAYAAWQNDDSPPAPSAVPLADLIVRTASRFVGLREVISNREWDNPATPAKEARLSFELREMMRPSPWEPGWAYCSAFSEGVVLEAMRKGNYPAATLAAFAEPMGAHVVTAAREFGKLGLLRDTPKRGAIWFGKWGSSASGHAGIVEAPNGGIMATIEANTGPGKAAGEFSAGDREGDWIDRRTRNVRQNGALRTIGFVWPEDVAGMG